LSIEVRSRLGEYGGSGAAGEFYARATQANSSENRNTHEETVLIIDMPWTASVGKSESRLW
jgi:hypothetical protein